MNVRSDATAALGHRKMSLLCVVLGELTINLIDIDS